MKRAKLIFGANENYSQPQFVPPPDNVRRLALPEGVIEKQGKVMGFVYFQNVLGRAHRLRLIWNARTPAGKPLGKTSVVFRVVTIH